MKTVYRANDGKIFNTEKECLDYEEGTIARDMNILNNKEKIIMYYDDGSKILSTENFCSLYEMLDYIYKVIFFSDEAITAFINLFPSADINDKKIKLKTSYIYNEFLGKFIKETDLFEIIEFNHNLSDYLSSDNVFYNIIKLYLSDTLDID